MHAMRSVTPTVTTTPGGTPSVTVVVDGATVVGKPSSSQVIRGIRPAAHVREAHALKIVFFSTRSYEKQHFLDEASRLKREMEQPRWPGHVVDLQLSFVEASLGVDTMHLCPAGTDAVCGFVNDKEYVETDEEEEVIEEIMNDVEQSQDSPKEEEPEVPRVVKDLPVARKKNGGGGGGGGGGSQPAEVAVGGGAMPIATQTTWQKSERLLRTTDASSARVASGSTLPCGHVHGR
eukprot:COSAG06_NODE_6209_length_3048_cov_8.167854_2_plen_234_part_00